MQSRDANLLFGILAVQLRLATPQQLLGAAGMWAAERERPLGSILVELGILQQRDRELIDSLLSRQLEAAGGDVSQVYELFGGDAAVEQSFGGSLVFEAARPDHGRYASLGPSDSAEISQPQDVKDEAGPGLTREHAGRYELRAEQGRGGVGRVLLAWDRHIEREVALKELLPGRGQSSASGPASGPQPVSGARRERFLREARITGQLEHPGILPVYELGQRSDGTVYYTMKLVRGQTLKEKLGTCRSLADRLALLPHFLDLCQAIAYAHSRGAIHRDIKPANVMIGEFGETLLLDWGLAKVQGDIDHSAEKLADEMRQMKEAGAGDSVEGKPIGTPSYMPPEQADGRINDVDERSDVWSLGAVLYEILCGEPPFRGSSALEVIGAVLSDPVLPVLERQPDAPPELAAIAMRCLERNRSRRYQHVSELAADIAAFQTGGLVGAYTYSSARMLQRWAMRHWPILTTAGIALLVLLGLGSYYYSSMAANNRALRQANRELDQSQNVLLSYKLASESERALALGRPELATLLALEAAHYYRRSNIWMPEVDKVLRACLATPAYGRDLLGHSGKVRRTIASPDYKLLATCGDDGIVCLWDYDNLQAPPRLLRGHRAGVSSCAFSADGNLLVTGGHDQTVRVWNLPQLKTVHELATPDCIVWSVALSPDGKWLAAAGADPDQQPGSSPNWPIRLWRMNDLAAEPLMLSGHRASIQSLCFMPDSRRLLSASDDHRLLAWDLSVSSPTVCDEAELPGELTWVTVSKAGDIAVCCVDHLVRIWPHGNLRLAPRVLRGHNHGVWAAAFSPDDKQLLSSGGDKRVLLWDLQQQSIEPRVVCASSVENVWTLAWDGDNKGFVSANANGDLQHWELDEDISGRLLRHGHRDIIRSLAISPDGKVLASGGRDFVLRLWDCKDPRAEPRSLPAGSQGPEACISALAFSQDGKRLVCGNWDSSLLLWDLTPAVPVARQLEGPSAQIRGVAISPDGRQLVSGCDDETLYVYKISGGAAELSRVAMNGTSAVSVAFSHDGRLFAAGTQQGQVRLWRADSIGEQAPTLLRCGDGIVYALAFSVDGKWLAAAGASSQICIWELADLEAEPRVLLGHRDEVFSLAFSPDCKLLASAGRDWKVRLWNMELPGSEPAGLAWHNKAVFAVAFTPDGRQLLSAGADSTIRSWPVDAGGLVALLEQLPRRNMSEAEWTRYVGVGIPYRKTLANLPESLHSVPPVP